MTQRKTCIQCFRPIVPGQHYYTVGEDCQIPPLPMYVHLACWEQWVKENPKGVATSKIPLEAKDVTA